VDVARYAQLFLADSREQLRAAAALLVDWEQNPDAVDAVPEVFRAFHSVKGSAAAMGYDSVTRLAHAAESLLDAIREERLSPSGPVVGLLLRSVEVLEQGAEAAVRGESIDDAPPLAEALARMAASGDTPPARPSGSRRAPRPSGALAAPQAAQSRMVRIEPALLDDLLLRAGELMVGWNRLERLTRHRADPAIEAVVGSLGSQVRNNHASVLRARLAPVEELLERFPRVVRDLGAALGRSVRLERLHQDEIELDRGMLEALVDPLVHLVRNAVDHGIESPTERSLLGKPAEGTVSIWATRDREWVTIHLADDGRGIDRERVVEQAIGMGLRGAGDPAPNDEELLTLLARPGFTLKQSVSEVSGRGVGMDVAVTTIRGLGGRVELESVPGQGTLFRLVVPMTTAIQRVLLVGASRQRFAIPFRVVLEASLPDSDPGGTITTGGGFNFRARELPIIDLGAAVGGRPAVARRRPVLVLEWGARQGALVVDSLLGQMDVRIERVVAPIGLPGWVSGATILADGSPAFVLDPTALFSG